MNVAEIKSDDIYRLDVLINILDGKRMEFEQKLFKLHIQKNNVQVEINFLKQQIEDHNRYIVNLKAEKLAIQKNS